MTKENGKASAPLHRDCSPTNWVQVLEQYRSDLEKRVADLGHIALVNDILCREQRLLNDEATQQRIDDIERWPR